MKDNFNNSNNTSSTSSIEARYANFFKVGQNAFEFILEFIQFYPENKEEHLHTRIITSPLYAKIFLKILQKSIEKYEKSFGTISEK